MSDTLDDQTVTEQPTERDDIRSDVRAAFDQFREKEAAAAPEPAPKPPAKAEAPATETAQETAERARDDRGRFARAEGEAPPATPQEPAQTAPEPQATDTKPAADKEDPSVTLARTLSFLPAADREKIAALPPEAQEIVLRREREREADYTRRTQAAAALRREYEPIEAIFKPHEDAMRQRGLTRAGMIQAWAGVESSLVQGGQRAVDVVAGIIENYRLDRGALADRLGIRQLTPQELQQQQEAPAQQQAGAVHPDVAREINELRQWRAQQEQMQRQQYQAGELARLQAVTTEMDRFATATDSAGALLHPYFHEVETDMERLALGMQARREQPSLSELYQQAVWANTSVRDRMLAADRAAEEAQRAAAERKRQEEARAKAEKARRASSPISGAPGSAQTGTVSSGSLRDDILAAHRQHQSRM